MLRAPEAGADDYLTTPFDMTGLTRRVCLWLRRVGPAAPVGPTGVRIHFLGRFYVEHGAASG